MNNELIKVFSNEEFGNVRVVEVNGEGWLVGKDVAEALGYSNSSKAIINHVDDEDKIFHMIETESQNGNVSKTKTAIINESGLYSLVLSSKLPSAKKFKRWITSEVLPDIRKHGVYMTDNVLEQTLSNPDFMIELLTNYKAEKQARIEAENKNAILTHVNKLYTSTEIAKEIGMRSAKALNGDLHDRHIQYQSNGTWVLYSDYADLGYVSIKQNVLDNGKVVYDRKWTQLGREFLLDLYNKL